MPGTVKNGSEVGIDARVAALRLRLVAKTDTSVNFGKWMRHRRDELKLTQAQVAKRLNDRLPEMAADKQRVSDWERGYNMPSDAYKPAIVRALEVDDLSYFYRSFGETEQPDVLDVLSRPSSDTAPGYEVLVGRMDDIEGLLNQLMDRLVAADVIAAVDADSQPKQQPAQRGRRKRAA